MAARPVWQEWPQMSWLDAEEWRESGGTSSRASQKGNGDLLGQGNGEGGTRGWYPKRNQDIWYDDGTCTGWWGTTAGWHQESYPGSWPIDGKGKGGWGTSPTWNEVGTWPPESYHGSWHSHGNGTPVAEMYPTRWHDGKGTTVAEMTHTSWPDEKGKGKGKAAVTAAWPLGVDSHSWPGAGQTKGGHAMTSAKGMCMKGEDSNAGWEESGYRTNDQQNRDPLTEADEWLKKLNDALGCPEKKVTMEAFNRSLKSVVTSHQEVTYADRDVSRFANLGTQPAKSWKARCFCPLCPTSQAEDAKRCRTHNEIATASVDWAYHLAAVLRLMPSGEDRRAYLQDKNLMDKEASHKVFFNGMGAGMEETFHHLLGALDPPVHLGTGLIEKGQSNGRQGPKESASYRMFVAQEQPPVNGLKRSAILAVIQLTLAFHQRLADWPGSHSHTKCFPWVVARHCYLGMQHHPLICIELALAAWGRKAELDMASLGPPILACSLGALEKARHDTTLWQKRLKIQTALRDASAPCLSSVIEQWVDDCKPQG